MDYLKDYLNTSQTFSTENIMTFQAADEISADLKKSNPNFTGLTREQLVDLNSRVKLKLEESPVDPETLRDIVEKATRPSAAEFAGDVVLGTLKQTDELVTGIAKGAYGLVSEAVKDPFGDKIFEEYEAILGDRLQSATPEQKKAAFDQAFNTVAPTTAGLINTIPQVGAIGKAFVNGVFQEFLGTEFEALGSEQTRIADLDVYIDKWRQGALTPVLDAMIGAGVLSKAQKARMVKLAQQDIMKAASQAEVKAITKAQAQSFEATTPMQKLKRHREAIHTMGIKKLNDPEFVQSVGAGLHKKVKAIANVERDLLNKTVEAVAANPVESPLLQARIMGELRDLDLLSKYSPDEILAEIKNTKIRKTNKNISKTDVSGQTQKVNTDRESIVTDTKQTIQTIIDKEGKRSTIEILESAVTKSPNNWTKNLELSPMAKNILKELDTESLTVGRLKRMVDNLGKQVFEKNSQTRIGDEVMWRILREQLGKEALGYSDIAAQVSAKLDAQSLKFSKVLESETAGAKFSKNAFDTQTEYNSLMDVLKNNLENSKSLEHRNLIQSTMQDLEYVRAWQTWNQVFAQNVEHVPSYSLGGATIQGRTVWGYLKKKYATTMSIPLFSAIGETIEKIPKKLTARLAIEKNEGGGLLDIQGRNNLVQPKKKK